jgi:hypothetical protein
LKFFWFDFAVRGERYRGSTQVTDEKRATTIASLKLAKALEGSDPLARKAPKSTGVFGEVFEWVETARLEFATRRYHMNGWRQLESSSITA